MQRRDGIVPPHWWGRQARRLGSADALSLFISSSLTPYDRTRFIVGTDEALLSLLRKRWAKPTSRLGERVVTTPGREGGPAISDSLNNLALNAHVVRMAQASGRLDRKDQLILEPRSGAGNRQRAEHGEQPDPADRRAQRPSAAEPKGPIDLYIRRTSPTRMTSLSTRLAFVMRWSFT